MDLIHSSHESFTAGIFWINCRTPDVIEACSLYIEKVSFLLYYLSAFN